MRGNLIYALYFLVFAILLVAGASPNRKNSSQPRRQSDRDFRIAGIVLFFTMAFIFLLSTFGWLKGHPVVPDIVLSICFMLLAIWLFVDAVIYHNDEEVNQLISPLAKHLRIPGAILLFIIGCFYLLDTIGLLHG